MIIFIGFFIAISVIFIFGLVKTSSMADKNIKKIIIDLKNSHEGDSRVDVS